MQCFIGHQWGNKPQQDAQRVGRGLVVLGYQEEPSLPPWFTVEARGLAAAGTLRPHSNGRDVEVWLHGWHNRADLVDAIDEAAPLPPRIRRTSAFRKICNLDRSRPLDDRLAGIYEEIRMPPGITGRVAMFTDQPRRYWRPFENLPPTP